MRVETNLPRAASVLAVAGAAWPNVLCYVSDFKTSPYQRALDAAWCGGGVPASEFLGHCAMCWTGSAALLLASMLALLPAIRSRACGPQCANSKLGPSLAFTNARVVPPSTISNSRGRP